MKKLFSGLMLAVFVASYSVFFCGCGEAESSSSEPHYFEESSQVSTKEQETVNKETTSKTTEATRECNHQWKEADCENPKTCTVCGATSGESLGHSWKEADYDNPQTCTVCGKTVGSPLERPAINLQLTNQLPCELSSYLLGETLHKTVLITDAQCTYEPYLYDNSQYIVNVCVSGEKTYDYSGDDADSICCINIKIYDEEGYVVGDDTIYTPSLRVGEKFRNEECSLIHDRLPAGNYRVELSTD